MAVAATEWSGSLGRRWRALAAERGGVLHATRSLRLRGLQAPAGRARGAAANGVALSVRRPAELPNLATGPKGELQLVYRRVTVLNNQPPNGPKIQQSRGIWNAYTCASTRDGWSDAVPLGQSCGRNDMRLAFAPGAGTNVVAYAADDRVRQRAEVFGTHQVQWAALRSPTAAAPPAAKPVATEPRDEALPRDPGRRPEPVWAVDGTPYELVYGDTHRHTDLSRCGMCSDGSLLDTYRYALDVAKLDFLAISDHDQDILRHRYDRQSRPFDTYAWWRSQKVADLMHHPPTFCAIYGYEHGGSYQARGGHKNVLYEVRGQPCLEVDAPEALFKALGDYNAIAIPHQLADGGSRCDWTKWNGQYETVAEIFQARGNYEHAAAPRLARDATAGFFYQDALQQGARIGVIASSDHGWSRTPTPRSTPRRVPRRDPRGAAPKRTYGGTAKVRLEFAAGGRPAGSTISATRRDSAFVSWPHRRSTRSSWSATASSVTRSQARAGRAWNSPGPITARRGTTITCAPLWPMASWPGRRDLGGQVGRGSSAMGILPARPDGGRLALGAQEGACDRLGPSRPDPADRRAPRPPKASSTGLAAPPLPVLDCGGVGADGNRTEDSRRA